MRLGDEVIIARVGDYVFVPRGTAHTYCNLGPEPAKMVNIMSPADGVELLTGKEPSPAAPWKRTS